MKEAEYHQLKEIEGRCFEMIRPEEIERRSFEIITRELVEQGIVLPEEQAPITKRAIHTSADFDYAKTLCYSKDAVNLALKLIRHGADIVTDTSYIDADMLMLQTETVLSYELLDCYTKRGYGPVDYVVYYEGGVVPEGYTAPTSKINEDTRSAGKIGYMM